MKNILIPTDFSLAAWNSTEFALRLFTDTACTFYFLNAYTPEIYGNRLMAGNSVITTNTCISQKASEKRLSLFVKRVKELYKNDLHDYVKISTFSLLIEAIREAVYKYSLDYIVMGSTGSKPDTNCFMGINTVRVLENVHNCPVLVIPKDFKFKNLSNITLLSDANYLFNGNELYPLKKLCKTFKSKVHIVNTKEVPGLMTRLQNLNIETIDHKLKNVPHHFYDITAEEPLDKALGEFIDQVNCQLLVVSNYTRASLKNLRINFIVERTVFYTEVPMLSLQAKGSHVVLPR